MINPEPYWGEIVDLSTFQFHIGMINPGLNIQYVEGKLGFQFHIGMINPECQEKGIEDTTSISIPHWYD